MLHHISHLLFAPMIGSWLRTSTRSWRGMPTPGERPRAVAAGPNADRLLLVGSGVAVGFGVTSAELALGGQLARRVSALTGRGTAVETVAHLGLRVRDCAKVLSEFHLSRFDAVVLTLGADESLQLMPASTFRRDLAGLVRWLEANAPRAFDIVLVGVPDVTSIMKIPRIAERPVRRQCERLNAVMTELCRQHDRVTYLPFDPVPGDLERDGGKGLYEAWAITMAPNIARVLDANAADPRDPATILEARRQSALDDLRILDTVPEYRYDRIVADARDLFGVGGASITFIDRDRQWSKSTAGIDPVDSPRGSALGDATVQNGKLFVVEDASIDRRFMGHPWVVGGSAVRFFAGFPIEAANGERVGALCLSDKRPRAFSSDEDALLGMLARRVQGELWGAAS